MSKSNKKWKNYLEWSVLILGFFFWLWLEFTGRVEPEMRRQAIGMAIIGGMIGLREYRKHKREQSQKEQEEREEREATETVEKKYVWKRR